MPAWLNACMNQFMLTVPGGGVRAPIPAGNVTLGAVIAVLPFGNVVSVVRVDGSALVAAAQNGVSGFPGQGRFPQVSWSVTHASASCTLKCVNVPWHHQGIGIVRLLTLYAQLHERAASPGNLLDC